MKYAEIESRGFSDFEVAPISYLNQGAVKLGQIIGREEAAMRASPTDVLCRDMAYDGE